MYTFLGIVFTLLTLFTSTLLFYTYFCDKEYLQHKIFKRLKNKGVVQEIDSKFYKSFDFALLLIRIGCVFWTAVFLVSAIACFL